MSRHAEHRSQQRGVTRALIETVLEHGDIEKWVGDNCYEIGVSRRTAQAIRGIDKLSRVGIVVSETSAQIVTVLPRVRRRYRPKYWRRP
jgi:hypothetical protein